MTVLFFTSGLAAPGLAGTPASFSVCANCHQVVKNRPSSVGPNLFKISNRAAGTLVDYVYTPEMKLTKIRWTRPQLIAFIMGPRKTVPGTKMLYAERNPQAAAAIADYLISLK